GAALRHRAARARDTRVRRRGARHRRPPGQAQRRHAQGDPGHRSHRDGGRGHHRSGHLRIRAAGCRPGRARARLLPGNGRPAVVQRTSATGGDSARRRAVRPGAPDRGEVMELLIAAFAFVVVVVVVVGLWWASASRRAVRERLSGAARAVDPGVRILHENPEEAARRLGWLARSSLYARLTALAQQSGRTGPVSDVLLVMATFAALGGLAGWIRIGAPGWSLLCALAGASIPVLCLVHKRQQRMKRFSKHFPDALDMMARAIRAGYALAGGIQLVGEEMPDPVGEELRRVFEEIRLGLEPGDALAKLAERIPTDDV